GLLLHGDIPRNSGGANDLATRGADRRNGERNRDDLAVLSEPGGLILCDGFTPSELRQNLWEFIRTFLRYPGSDGLAWAFLGRIAIHALGPPVPIRDDSLQGLTDDGVLRGLHDGR